MSCRRQSPTPGKILYWYCNRWIALVTTVLIAWSAGTVEAGPIYSYEQLLPLNMGQGVGWPTSTAYDVNNDGWAVGGSSSFFDGSLASSHRAVRWSPASTAAMALATSTPGPPYYPHGLALSVRNDGVIAGRSRYVNGTSDFSVVPHVWLSNGLRLRSSGVSGYINRGSGFDDLNDLGAAVGYGIAYTVQNEYLGPRAGFWSADRAGSASGSGSELGVTLGTWESLEDSWAFGLNNAGVAVGEARKSHRFDGNLPRRAMVWADPDQPGVALPAPGDMDAGGARGSARAINELGQIVGEAILFVNGQDMGQVPVRWDPLPGGGYEAVVLEVLGGRSFVLDISDNGWAVGRIARTVMGEPSSADLPVLWAPDGTAYTLDEVAGSAVSSGIAYGISDDGRFIVGLGGDERAFRLTLVPEPASLLLPAAALALLLRRRDRVVPR